jgi:hypothetical protein
MLQRSASSRMVILPTFCRCFPLHISLFISLLLCNSLPPNLPLRFSVSKTLLTIQDRYNAGLPQSEPTELPAEGREIKPIPPRRNPSRLNSREGSMKRDFSLKSPVQPPPQELPSIFRSMAITCDEEVPPPPPKDPPKTPPNISRWQPPSSWEIPGSQKELVLGSPSDSSPDGSPDKVDHRRSRADMMTHFQRFVRRMEGAGPRIILERLKEEWDEPVDRAMSDELQLEKHLWALTALQLRALDRFARFSQASAPSGPLPPLSSSRRRKILELDGSIGRSRDCSSFVLSNIVIGEIYQLSAIYPNSKIAHLTINSPGSSIPLPSQATQHAVNTGSPTNSVLSIPISAGAGLVPLPYANSSMHHIRSARLASLLPATQLPSLLSECFRVLKPGGILELRLMDATPERGSMGPRLATWLEERLLLGLEREFRCQRPLTLIPRWAQEAGFTPLPFKSESESQGTHTQRYNFSKLGLTRCLRLPATAVERESGSRDIVAQVGVLVGRALWKDAWGTFVHDDYEEHWWWDNPDVVDECREWKTVWDVGTLYVVKGDKAC